MVPFSKIMLLPILPDEKRFRKNRLIFNNLSTEEIQFLLFLYILNPFLQKYNINRFIVELVYPHGNIQELFDRLEAFKIIFKEKTTGNYRIINRVDVYANFESQSSLKSDVKRSLHEIAGQYYTILLRNHISLELGIELHYHTFAAKDESEFFLPDFRDYRNTEQPRGTVPDIFSQPCCIQIPDEVNRERREFEIAIARSLTCHAVNLFESENHLLEACRIWNNVVHQSADECIYEFIGTLDALFYNTFSMDGCYYLAPAEKKFIEILTMLDGLTLEATEICEYCRCFIFFRLANVHVFDKDSKSVYWAGSAVIGFGEFVRHFGIEYLKDYVYLFKGMEGDINRYFWSPENLKEIWPSMIAMKEWCQSRCNECPSVCQKEYAALLNQYGSLLFENQRKGVITLMASGSNGESSQPENLRSYQEQWINEAVTLHRTISQTDKEALSGLATALEIKGKSIKIGLVSGGMDINSAVRSYEESAEIRWDIAENCSSKEYDDRKKYLHCLADYTSTLHSLCSLYKYANRTDVIEKTYKKILTLSRILWKVRVHFVQFFCPISIEYSSVLEEVGRYYSSIGDTRNVVLCNEELSQTKKNMYVAVFGEEYKEQENRAALVDAATNSEGKRYRFGNYCLKKYEVKPGMFLWLYSSNVGTVIRANPDIFFFPELIKDDDIDIDSIYRRLYDKEFLIDIGFMGLD